MLFVSFRITTPRGTKKSVAGVLSDAAGVKLGDIQNMDYSWGRIDFEFRPMQDMSAHDYLDCCALQEKSLDLDIEPDDIEVQDTVTVVWEISS